MHIIKKGEIEMISDKPNLKIFFLLIYIFWLNHLVFSDISFNVTGKVIDEETGDGIKGIKIIIFHKFSSKVDTITDEDGFFRIGYLSNGIYGIDFRPPKPYAWENINYSSLDQFAAKGMQTFKIDGKSVFILKKCKIGGILELRAFEKDTNKPIEGIKVFSKDLNLALQSLTVNSTNSQGIYSLERLAEGKCDIYLQKDGLFMKHLKDIEIKSKQTTTVEVPYNLASKAKIIGRVICRQTNEPIKDIFVNISGRNGIQGSAKCYTDNNGHFAVADMVVGKYELFIFYINDKDERKWISKTVFVNKDRPVNVNFSLDCNLNYEKKGD